MRPKHGAELPHAYYPIDPWAIVETEFQPELTPLLETVFSLGNGHLGVRGAFHTGRPAHQPGAFINGFYETWPIQHPESAYGLATAGQTIVCVPDPTPMRAVVDGSEVMLGPATVTEWVRSLELRRGILTHRYRWTAPSGTAVDIESTRLVSIEESCLVASRHVVAVDHAAAVELIATLVNRQDTDYLEPSAVELDPRRARNFGRRVLEPTDLRAGGRRTSVSYQTVQSNLDLAVATLHVVDREAEAACEGHPDRPQCRIVSRLGAGESITVDTFTVYVTGAERGADRAEAEVDAAAARGFAAVVSGHTRGWRAFWEEADVEIGADPSVQQALRWILFQLHQASATNGSSGIAAKGVTGQAYEGHYFWDTEIFVLPFLLYTRPGVAEQLLRFRHEMLPQARARAEQLHLRGALFPWRTINGEEASAYYAAGTAQYHINADIAFALRQYVAVTGNDELLWEVGVEILIETARMWADLGFHRDGAFHIYGVTGPDEYTALVDDNAYTNLMARMNLAYAAASVERMRRSQPARWAELARRLGFGDHEQTEWLQAASAMYVPHDEGFGITPQDQSFLAKERWDFDATPAHKYPLLLHFHPLVIYRYQVLKQADVVLATFLLGDEFSPELKKANFAYYDPLTTGDSSLSACVQSIMAAEVGLSELSMEYFRTALFMDLADLHGNTTDGVHMASAGGVWMAVVYGMAGLRDYGGRPSFDPRLPKEWSHLRFTLRLRTSRLHVDIDHDRLRLRTEGPPLRVSVRGRQVRAGDKPVEVKL